MASNEPSPDEEAEARRRAKEYVAQLKAGKNWVEVQAGVFTLAPYDQA